MLIDPSGLLPAISRFLLLASGAMALLTIVLTARILFLGEGSMIWALFCVGFTLSMALVAVFIWILAQGLLHDTAVIVFYSVFLMTEIIFLKLLGVVRARVPRLLMGF